MPPTPPTSFADAETRLLDAFAWNGWFLTNYWPENRPRVRLMARLAEGAGRELLDVGCANGYIAAAFRLLGFSVTAVDHYDDEKRDELFRDHGIGYVDANLNDPDPLASLPAASADVVLLGEVFEHILNNPKGLVENIFRVLRPGGRLLLTTPNPSTLANALRVLADRYVPYGMPEFMTSTKFDGRKVISRGDIHYNEYPAWLVRDLLAAVGFVGNRVHYTTAGVAQNQGRLKRWLKGALIGTGLTSTRLFGVGYVIDARKPG